MPKRTTPQKTAKIITKAIPKFKSEADEKRFWAEKTNNATEYFDAATMKPAKL